MVYETDTDAQNCATDKVWHDRDGAASDGLVLAEQALIKHPTADHDKVQLEAARNLLESVTALLEENDFWKR